MEQREFGCILGQLPDGRFVLTLGLIKSVLKRVRQGEIYEIETPSGFQVDGRVVTSIHLWAAEDFKSVVARLEDMADRAEASMRREAIKKLEEYVNKEGQGESQP